MTMMDRYEQDFVIFKIMMWIVFGALITLVVYSVLQWAFGDDNEAELGLCQRGFKDHCPETQLQHDLKGSLMIWNSANCSVRDICTPNTCFATKELADLYIKQFGNESGDVHVPCPKLNVTGSDNELEGK